MLVKKMKGHGPELKRDLNGAMLKVSGLVQKLLQGSPEETLGELEPSPHAKGHLPSKERGPTWPSAGLDWG